MKKYILIMFTILLFVTMGILPSSHVLEQPGNAKLAVAHLPPKPGNPYFLGMAGGILYGIQL